MRTLILGTSPLAAALVEVIKNRSQHSYDLIGVVCELGTDKLRSFPCSILGSLKDLRRIIAELKPARIVVALTERRGYLPIHKLIEAWVFNGIIVENGDEVYERITGKIAIDSLTPSSVVFSRDFHPSSVAMMVARGIGLLVAIAVLVTLAPLFGLIAVAIKCESRGPVFFTQDRIGLGGKSFRIWKFRTMHPTDKRLSEWVRDNDHRITRVGRWLRKYRLDELPQFYNVLRGDMNLVGPRPHPASNYGLFTLVSRNIPECGGPIPYYSLRSMVRPGITGWAQIRYQYANDLNEEMEKLRYDLYYIKHHSVWLDLRILFETIKVVLTGGEQSKIMSEEAKIPQKPATPLISESVLTDVEVTASHNRKRQRYPVDVE